MRNLKKILALVLALVMSFSLMATANAFTDDEQITDTYETAVTVLDGLKVFQGYDDGSFQPQGAITRAEVAAIIYRIVTGDVTDAQVGIYADYNKFDDVKSTSWYAGYVNFCANAEYIKGYDARTFGPNDPVTGYQALAMILRALGYDKNGEFTGSSWQVQTAAVGENRGITKNIAAGTLGTAASREVVAEILFQAILVDKVNYTPAFGYQLDDTSIGWDTFELEDIEGVVIANEYADLYNTKPLKAGKTELNVDGDSYVLAYASELTDIGEARHAYITEGENVLYLADAGNTVFETGAATDIEKDKDFEKATGLERDDDTTEYFINFDGGAEYKASDWKISYVLKFANETAAQNWVDAYPGTSTDVTRDGVDVTVEFGRNDVISRYDINRMADIFDSADKEDENSFVDGEVYVGTQSITDISDDPDVSWDIFLDKYIDTAENVVDFDETDNGEWLKVIDNDGDGVADYVLLTEFAMSVIERISKDDEYTLADLAGDDAVRFDRNTVEIDGADIVTEDELAEEDVVIYTLIDGKYYMNIAEMVTETVDKKGIDKHDETMTCDGTVYTQSHIGYTDDTNYYTDVTEAHTEVTYDLYLDHFGYVRLFIESDYNTFMLLTDGYYKDNNRTETFQAYYWDVEADEETQIDVVDNDYAADFIFDGKAPVINSDVDVWGRLLGADRTYLVNNWADWNRVYATNIAGYTDTGDGYALKDVRDSAMRKSYDVQAINVTANTDLDDESLNARGTAADIQTTTDTQYYLVIRSQDDNTVTGWTVDDVITWTGYENAPDEAELNFEDGAVVGYAVTRDTKTSGHYTVADVVVFETEAYSDRDTYFVYDVNNWNPIEYVYGIGYDDEGAIDDENKLLVEDDAGDIRANGMIEFYKIYDDERVDFIGDETGEYADHYIYAGWTQTGYDVENRNYIRVDVYTNIVGSTPDFDDMYISLDAPIYYVDTDSSGDYVVKELDRDDVKPGDKLIVFANKDDKVQYAIDVSKSVDENGNIFPDLYTYLTMPISSADHGGVGLWDRIVADTVSTDYPTWYEDVKDRAEAALALYENAAATDTEKLAALEGAQKALADLLAHKDKLTAAQVAELGSLSGLVGQAVDALKEIIGDAQDIQDIVDEMIAAWDAYDDAPTADTRKALAQALVNYLNHKTDMTDAQKADAELAELNATAVINGLTRPTAVKNADGKFNMAYTAIQAEYREATALQPAEIAAYDLLNPNADLQELVDKVKADYAEATEIMGYVNDLINANKVYQANKTNTAAQNALVTAYRVINEKELHSEPIKTLLGGADTTAWKDEYAPAYRAAHGLSGTADTALIKEAKDAIDEWLKNNDWADITLENGNKDDFNAEIKDQVTAILTAADIDGVTVTINNGNWTTIPAVGSEDDEVYFQIQLTAGAGTLLEVNEQTVKVINNHTEASIKAAVEDVVDNYQTPTAAYWSNNGGWNGLKAAIEAAIDSVGGVSDGTVTSTTNTFKTGDVFDVEYTFVYDEVTYVGTPVSITVK